ncbi:hypothetical protein AZA_83649 [Nitrospirillum viridazoti Y2]|nr:hypothetical protein AZA_83649 [Nitrospirillum amazonense Y2]
MTTTVQDETELGRQRGPQVGTIGQGGVQRLGQGAYGRARRVQAAGGAAQHIAHPLRCRIAVDQAQLAQGVGQGGQCRLGHTADLQIGPLAQIH